MNAYQYSLRLLAQRDYSQKKLTKKLLEKSFEAEEINQAISKLVENNYLREEEYKRAKTRYYLKKGYSPQLTQKKLSQELEISTDEIHEIAHEASISSADKMQELIQKKIKINNLQSLDYESKTKLILKAKRFLYSKGYSFEQINSAMRQFEQIDN
jgi:regulatory protein